MRIVSPIFPAAAFAAALLAACMDDQVAGTSTETVTGKTTGFIYLADGKPARGARVDVRPVGYRPLQDAGSSGSFLTTTDDQGRYLLDSLASGEYHVLARLGSQYAFLDSVPISGTGRTLPSDTLGEPGTLSGVVALQPGDPLPSATIQVLGTYAYANVDEDGRFTLPPLPEGRHRLMVATTLAEYTPRYVEVNLSAGNVFLGDTLRPIYTGIPVVENLGARFDTLAQEVTLAWSPTAFRYLKEYVVLRRPKGSFIEARMVGATGDTLFVDRLETGNNLAYEYRVAVKDQFDHMGRTFGGVEVQTPPASAASSMVGVRVANALRRGGFPDRWETGIGDTVHFIAEYSSAGRNLRRIRWFSANGIEPVRTAGLAGRSGADTLTLAAPSSPAGLVYTAEVTDEAGHEWRRTTALEVVQDAPLVVMPPRATGEPGKPLRVFGVVTNVYGRIVKMEWSVGGGAWSAPTLSNDTVLVPPDTGLQDFPVILRVTDEDGQAALDTTLVTANPWRKGPGLPNGLAGHALVALQGRLYALGGLMGGSGTAQVHRLDPAAGVWQSMASMGRSRIAFAAAIEGGRIFAFGGHHGGALLSAAEAYDPAADRWTPIASLPRPRSDHAAVAVGDRIYLLGGYVPDPSGATKATDWIDVYDPAADSWSSFQSPMPVWGALQASALDGVIYAFAVGKEQRGAFARFLPSTCTWEPLGQAPDAEAGGERRLEHSVTAHNGRIHIVGGYRPATLSWSGNSHRDFSAKTYVYNPATRDWNGSASLPVEISGAGLAVLGDILYSVGGMKSTTAYYNNPDYLTDKWAPTGEVFFRRLP